jgi:hypothetical protein
VLGSSYITQKARKGAASAIEGRGLVAVAPIAADEVVAIKGGHIITTATLQSLPERLKNSEIQIADGFHLAALEEAEYEPVMLFINHSCEPSVGFAGNTVLVAMHDIGPGEELTTDYALFDDHDEVMKCQCGMPSCRGMISGRDWQRPELQRKYGRYFSSYLIRRLAHQPDQRPWPQIHPLMPSDEIGSA